MLLHLHLTFPADLNRRPILQGSGMQSAEDHTVP
jgi:hypothetical protein